MLISQRIATRILSPVSQCIYSACTLNIMLNMCNTDQVLLMYSCDSSSYSLYFIFSCSDDDNLIELQPILGWSEFQNEYINASYIDVSNNMQASVFKNC